MQNKKERRSQKPKKQKVKNAGIKVLAKLPAQLVAKEDAVKTPIFSKHSPDGGTANVKKWRYAAPKQHTRVRSTGGSPPTMESVRIPEPLSSNTDLEHLSLRSGIRNTITVGVSTFAPGEPEADQPKAATFRIAARDINALKTFYPYNRVPQQSPLALSYGGS